MRYKFQFTGVKKKNQTNLDSYFLTSNDSELAKVILLYLIMATIPLGHMNIQKDNLNKYWSQAWSEREKM